MTMDAQIVRLGDEAVAGRIARVIRNARRLTGWSQRELASRARTTQSAVCRLESARAPVVDLVIVGRVLDALGLDARLVMEGRHLLDRERQHDGVHARITGFVARRVERWGWLTAGETLIGPDRPRGWIDLLAFRQADRALVVEETKTEIPDFGALQRSLAFYEREAVAVARRFGWQPRSVNVLVVALDSMAIAARLADNRDLVRIAFPEPVLDVLRWLEDPSAPRPRGWAVGTCDPASRRRAWLRPTMFGSRRTPPAYGNYADAAARLLLPPR